MLILSVILLSIFLAAMATEVIDGMFEKEEVYAMVILIGIPWSYLLGQLIQKLI
ncbi:hypothetical protein [Bacillus pseudomycoides]|uniref:hypothetical protein n=1 Tax=Bacillus pseudomycoides TaxID=64104 RepID=UPI0015CF09FD|nr:hypothetical protein [Bacillus pseudomycoides]